MAPVSQCLPEFLCSEEKQSFPMLSLSQKWEVQKTTTTISSASYYIFKIIALSKIYTDNGNTQEQSHCFEMRDNTSIHSLVALNGLIRCYNYYLLLISEEIFILNKKLSLFNILRVIAIFCILRVIAIFNILRVIAIFCILRVIAIFSIQRIIALFSICVIQRVIQLRNFLNIFNQTIIYSEVQKKNIS